MQIFPENHPISTLWESIRLETRSRSPWTGWSSASWGSTRYSQSTSAWRASANWPENKRASSNLCCLRRKHSKLFSFLHFIHHSIIPKWVKVIWQNISPLHTLSTNCVPFVTDLAQQVVQFLRVCWQCGLVSHGLPRAHCGVIHWLLGAKRLLEILQYSD